MSKKSLDECRDGEDIIRYSTTHGAKVLSQNGSHVKLALPNGTTEIVPNHRKDLGKGLRCKIVKTLIASGISIFLVGVVVLCNFA